MNRDSSVSACHSDEGLAACCVKTAADFEEKIPFSTPIVVQNASILQLLNLERIRNCVSLLFFALNVTFSQLTKK